MVTGHPLVTLVISGVVVFGGAALLGWGVERGLLWFRGRTPRQEARRVRAREREEALREPEKEPGKREEKSPDPQWLRGVPAIGWGVDRALLWFQGRTPRREARRARMREREEALREQEKARLELQWSRGVPATVTEVVYRSESEYETDLRRMALMGYVPIEVCRKETGHGFCYEVRYHFRLDGRVSDVLGQAPEAGVKVPREGEEAAVIESLSNHAVRDHRDPARS